MKDYILVYDSDNNGFCPTYFDKNIKTDKYNMRNFEFSVPAAFSEDSMQCMMAAWVGRDLTIIQAEHDIYGLYIDAERKYRDFIFRTDEESEVIK